MKSIVLWCASGAVMVLMMIVALPKATTAFAAAGDLTGQAWSSNIGWIDFGNAGATYGVKLAMSGATRNLSGYAWSSNIGWVTFNNTECPVGVTGNCQPRVEWGVNGGPAVLVKGFARACGVFANGCTSGTPLKNGGVTGLTLGGWDGFISLGDSNTADSVNYGVKINTGTGVATGRGWGSEVVGWVDFTGVKVAVGDPGVEICGNGIDEDGNGSDLPCPPGTEICGNGIDEDGNGSDLPCPPGTEICGNGTDDDGDGFIDENCPGGPSCSDGIRNQNETGVDTGGVCGNGSNGTCFDGIKNQNETDIDYGGVCGIPGTCFDGIKNQNETGVDTGGVCTTDPDTQICSNISNEFLALLTPPITDVSELSLHHYRKLANGRCACQTGYILNAELMCVRPTYQEK